MFVRLCVCLYRREISEESRVSFLDRPVPRVCHFNSIVRIDAYIHTHTHFKKKKSHTYMQQHSNIPHTHTHTHGHNNSLINLYLTWYQSSANSTHASVHYQSSLSVQTGCLCECACLCVDLCEQAWVCNCIYLEYLSVNLTCRASWLLILSVPTCIQYNLPHPHTYYMLQLSLSHRLKAMLFSYWVSNVENGPA